MSSAHWSPLGIAMAGFQRDFSTPSTRSRLSGICGRPRSRYAFIGLAVTLHNQR
jgi:hypothetical protein